MKNFKVTLVSILILFLGNGFAWAESEERKTTDADYARLLKVLKEYKIDPVKSNIKKKDIEWWATCGNSEEGQIPTVHIVLGEPATIMGQKLQKGSELQICDWGVRTIDSMDERGVRQSVNIQGYACRSPVSISRSGKLCRCNLAEKKIINGFEIPEETVMLLLKGKPYLVGLRVPPKGVKKASPRGTYLFKKNKLVPGGNEEYITTCDDFVSSE